MAMTPNKNESQQDFLKRCGKEKSKADCSRIWQKSKGKNMNISMREFRRAPDLDKIRSVAGNPELDPADVCDFGSFLICRSGTFNGYEITNEAQKQAVGGWIGKQILYQDHVKQVSNQIGRIYDAWTVEHDGEIETYGRGFGVRTDDLSDVFKRIENGVHREMSCGFYETANGFEPDHISFVSDPAIEGAGLVLNSADHARLSKLAQDGETFRQWASDEFRRWYQRSYPQATADESETLSEKLSAREMVTLARIEKTRFAEALPDGRQMTFAHKAEPDAEPSKPEPVTLRDISNAIRKDMTYGNY